MAESEYVIGPALSALSAVSQDGLYLAYDWRDDRFVQQIILREGERRQKVLTSVEGSSADVWPTSPPLQQLHQQQIDGQDAILGVGMSGTSHYSSSMVLATKDDANELQIESACCLKAVDEQTWLGSRFKLETDFSIERLDSRGMLIQGSSVNAKIVIIVEPGESRIIQASDELVDIVPVAIGESGTTQWKYRMKLQ